MKIRIFGIVAVIAALALSFTLYVIRPVSASDHQDSPVTVARPGADITDPYIFPAPDNPNNVVMVMNEHPLIPAGQGSTVSFDPGVVYQMNFDGVDENLGKPPAKSISQTFVIQLVGGQPGSNQPLYVYGPAHPVVTGNQTQLLPMTGSGTINKSFTVGDMKVFAGVREESFFFDLAQFYKILPDRDMGSTAQSCLPKIGNDTCPQGFNTPGTDFFKDYNVLSIVIEMPRAELIAGCGGSKIAYWVTTNTSSGQ